MAASRRVRLFVVTLDRAPAYVVVAVAFTLLVGGATGLVTACVLLVWRWWERGRA